jgi:tetratricopeptide (TPR) repeat protein
MKHRLLRLFAGGAVALAVAVARQGRRDEAVGRSDAAIRLNPAYPEAYNNLKDALASAGWWREAEEQAAAIVRALGRYGEAENELAAARRAVNR